MDQNIEPGSFELDNFENQPFFAPANSDLLDGLVGQRNLLKQRIEELAEIMKGPVASAFPYFVQARLQKGRNKDFFDHKDLFDTESAIKKLDADFWKKAFGHTDVVKYMPMERQNQWNNQLSSWTNPDAAPDMQMPEFTEPNVRATIGDLLARRHMFFAELVDGIFRALSSKHVTNRPEGFSKRLILSNVFPYGSPDSAKYSHITSLRTVIGMFMGREEPHSNSTYEILLRAYASPGQWLVLDGGTLKLRAYGVGSVHLEVHPDMSCRLNQALASLYPMAIPAKFRTRQYNKPTKEFGAIVRPLPMDVLKLLSDFQSSNEGRTVSLHLGYQEVRKEALAEVTATLESVGGVKRSTGWWMFDFDYDATTVIHEILTSGCLPDVVSHQFYQTSAALADDAVIEADIGPDDNCLEPSAGLGALADLMPKDRTTCVELSKLHCAVLSSKGHKVHNADFLKWAEENQHKQKFTRIVCNPPFSEGRYQAHIEAAIAMLDPVRGRLVAILPPTAKKKLKLEGFDVSWSHIYENQFAGTGASVVILTATRKAVANRAPEYAMAA